jgi:hypothetical protein
VIQPPASKARLHKLVWFILPNGTVPHIRSLVYLRRKSLPCNQSFQPLARLCRSARIFCLWVRQVRMMEKVGFLHMTSPQAFRISCCRAQLPRCRRLLPVPRALELRSAQANHGWLQNNKPLAERFPFLPSHIRFRLLCSIHPLL